MGLCNIASLHDGDMDIVDTYCWIVGYVGVDNLLITLCRLCVV